MYSLKKIELSTICTYCEESNENKKSDFCCDDCEKQYNHRLDWDNDNY